MRNVLIFALLAFAPVAAAQVEQPYQSEYVVVGQSLTLEGVKNLPPELLMMVEAAPLGITTMSASEVEKVLRSGREVRAVRKIASDACKVDNTDLRAERKASDDNLREMKKRDEIVTVIQQYEQEMYYEARFAEIYEKACGKKPSANTGQTLPMRERICKASDPPCKARKHW